MRLWYAKVRYDTNPDHFTWVCHAGEKNQKSNKKIIIYSFEEYVSDGIMRSTLGNRGLTAMFTGDLHVPL